MIDWLQEDLPPHFPNTQDAQVEPNGLLAAGGQLSPAWLIHAYRRGIFPWYDDESPILWWSPAPRMVLKAEDFHLGRSLKKVMKKTLFKISCDRCFEDVIYQCAQPRAEDEGTWITDEMMEAYVRLNENGISHSIECWDVDGTMVGGLYGLQINGAFFGESMFSHVSNASKLAFAYLAQYLFSQGVSLIDCQMHSDHMAQFGAQEIDRSEFEARLALAIQTPLAIQYPVFLR